MSRQCPLFWDDPRAGCANGGELCRGGSCRSRAIYCEAKECPAYLPVLCPDGACVVTASECPNSEGCFPWVPFRCSNGQCASSAAACTNTTSGSCAANEVRCWSGRCDTQCPDKQNCESGDTRCLDGTCVSTRDAENNECIQADPSGRVLPNECPFNRPVRCPDGYCAVSSLYCAPEAVDPDNHPCKDPALPVFCASGDCVRTTEHCPLIAPCGNQETRCGDGTCRNDNNGRLTRCPEGTTCPVGYKRCNGVGED